MRGYEALVVTASPVTEYAEAVLAGRGVVGQLVRMACERHLRDLSDGEHRGLWFDERAADRAIRFFAQLKQTKGRWADEGLTLLPWQQFCIGNIFGWKLRDTGRRRFRTAYIEIGRKNGKSTLAAGVALYLLDFDNEPGAEVYAAATKRDQAKIVWGEAASMVRKTPALRRRMVPLDSRGNISVKETSSKFEALGADSDTLDGLNVHGSIVDELHAHKDRKVVDLLETATGARLQPLHFYITTAGVKNKESIYSEFHDRAKRILEGTSQDDAWFCYVATLDLDDDWTDPNVYIKANPSLGVTIQLEELIQERDRALDAPGRQNAFRRLRLNQQTEQDVRWLPMEIWDAPEAAEPINVDDLIGRGCYGGLDLSTTTDLASWALLFPPLEEEDRWIVLLRNWLPKDNMQKRVQRDGVPYDVWEAQEHIELTEGNVIDYAWIREAIDKDSEKYRIVEIGYDPWNATQLVTWLQEDGANLVPIRQGFASMSAPSKRLEQMVLGRQLQHGANPVLRWAASNVTVLLDPQGNIKPDKSRSSEKIDPIIALICAIACAMRHEGDGGSVYDVRGLLVL